MSQSEKRPIQVRTKLVDVDNEAQLVKMVVDTYEINDIPNLSAYKKRKKAFLQSHAGKEIQKCKRELFTELHGFKIYFVDEDQLIRGGVSGHFDFTMGGHGYRYLYIPDDEIWLDSNTSEETLWPLIWHEYGEAIFMREGKTYDKAHYTVSGLEIQHRREGERCLTFLCEEQMLNLKGRVLLY